MGWPVQDRQVWAAISFTPGNTLAQVAAPSEQIISFMGSKYFVLTLWSWLGGTSRQAQVCPPGLLRAQALRM